MGALQSSAVNVYEISASRFNVSFLLLRLSACQALQGLGNGCCYRLYLLPRSVSTATLLTGDVCPIVFCRTTKLGRIAFPDSRQLLYVPASGKNDHIVPTMNAHLP